MHRPYPSPLCAVKLVQWVAACALLAEPAHHPAQQHCGGGLVAGADLAAPEVGLQLRQVLITPINLWKRGGGEGEGAHEYVSVHGGRFYCS